MTQRHPLLSMHNPPEPRGGREEQGRPMKPVHYLSGATIGFRAPMLADAAEAVRWLPGPFPHYNVHTERLLRDEETDPWANSGTTRLVAVEHGSGRIVGG